MSLKPRIKAAVDSAFNAASDLVSSGRLVGKSVSSYDFATNKTVSKSSSASVDVIVFNNAKSTDSSKSSKAVIKSGVDISSYSTLVVDKTTYSIEGYDDNGFTIDLTLVKEV